MSGAERVAVNWNWREGAWFGRSGLNGRIVWQGLLFSQRVLLSSLCLKCFAWPFPPPA